jgi:hypothetical protein
MVSPSKERSDLQLAASRWTAPNTLHTLRGWAARPVFCQHLGQFFETLAENLRRFGRF